MLCKNWVCALNFCCARNVNCYLNNLFDYWSRVDTEGHVDTKGPQGLGKDLLLNPRVMMRKQRIPSPTILLKIPRQIWNCHPSNFVFVVTGFGPLSWRTPGRRCPNFDDVPTVIDPSADLAPSKHSLIGGNISSREVTRQFLFFHWLESHLHDLIMTLS